MLDGMRKASQGWLGRIVMAIVMGVISLSFVVWGVGDIFRGFGSNTVAKVGKTEITADAVRNAYQTELQQLQRQARRAVTNEQARQLGLDSRVLGKLVAEAALDNRVRELGLAMSDQEIAKTILTDSTFAGATGKFDAAKFGEILRDNGLTERGFALEQRRVYLRQELIEALAGNVPVPKATLEALHRYRNETRSVEYIELPASAAGDVPAPDDAALQAWFDARKQTFRAPEYRGVVTLSLSPAQVADPAAVSDADATATYNRVRLQRFGAQEKRDLDQALFSDEKTAAAAAEKIKAGATLEAAAEEFKTQVAPMGSVVRNEVFDKPIGEAGFALPEGGVSAPVKGQFGFVLVRATKVVPETVKTYAEVADDLKKEIATERAKKRVGELRDKIEDERTSGKALADAARAAGLTATTIEAIDQNGLDRNGKEVENLAEREALLRAVFASDVGVDNETLNAKDGGYVWFEVSGVEKAREQTLAEVKDKALAAWREEEVSKRLAAKAAEMTAKLDAGETLEALAKAAGDLPVQTNGEVRRAGGGSLPAGVVARVFALPSGKAGSAAGNADSRVVFRVVDAVTPVMDPDSDTLKDAETQLKTAFGEDLLVQYLAKLQTNAGVTINEAAARLATGGVADQN